MNNPYSELQDYQFWRRSISNIERHLFDPVTKPRFQIGADAKVATAGSCFAQHISRRLQEIDFNYFVTEDGSMLPEDERRRRQFGTFSARFGNIYTTTQLHQLFQEAFGHRAPVETAWRRPDGAFIDPYRQQIEPKGFASEDCLRADRASHLAAVRRMFEECDIFIFTLGLTEGWRSKIDGSVFPLAPGVAGGDFDSDRYEFVNFGVNDSYADLAAFLDGLKTLNHGVRVLLTVSPVPLIATYEDRSVLCSTTYSKSVLRVVAEMAREAYDWIDYFPSYEIITGSYAGGAYFENDFREINARGVAHVMRCFLRNLVEQEETAPAISPVLYENKRFSSDIVCDEEMLAAVRSGS